MKPTIETEWDEELGLASCIITDKFNRIHVGIAQCHEDDLDMKNSKTGCAIAQRRAEISVLKSYIRDELKPRLRALKQLYYSSNRSQKFNETSYESKRIKKQIYLTEKELTTTKTSIKELQADLKVFLEQKEEFYQKIRQLRAKDSTD